MSESVLQIFLIVNNHLPYMDLIAFHYSHISVFVCVGVGECLYVSVRVSSSLCICLAFFADILVKQ